MKIVRNGLSLEFVSESVRVSQNWQESARVSQNQPESAIKARVSQSQPESARVSLSQPADLLNVSNTTNVVGVNFSGLA